MSEHACAIVGLGGMGDWHRELIQGNGVWNRQPGGRIERLRLAGSFDIREERQAYARSVGLNAYPSLDALLADEKVELVLCATPNDVHREIVVRALEAGKNVVCEKPAAISSAEFQEMMDAAKRTGKLLTVHQNRRWDADFRAIQNLCGKRLIGRPFRIESRVHGSRGIPGDWRKQPEHGGGMLLDWGVHLLDQALMMVPEKVVGVYASFTNVTGGRVEDGFTVELRFESGLIYLAEVGTCNYLSLPRWYVLGSGGTALIPRWNVREGKIACGTGRGRDDTVPVPAAAGLTKTMAPRTEDTVAEKPIPEVETDVRDFYRNVIAAMERRARPLVEPEQVMRVLRLIEVIFESARRHQAMPFEQP